MGITRTLRLSLALGMTAASAAVVGAGGLAAWTVVTENDNSTVATGSVHHSNVATVNGGAAVTCNDTNSPASCGAVFTVAGMKPGQSVNNNTVKITNTGSLQSTFVLSQPSAPVTTSAVGGHTTLCSNLTMTIVDNESTPATIYNGAITMAAGVNLKASTGSVNFNNGDSGTYTFTITLPATSPYTDSESTCTAKFLWTQTNT